MRIEPWSLFFPNKVKGRQRETWPPGTGLFVHQVRRRLGWQTRAEAGLFPFRWAGRPPQGPAFADRERGRPGSLPQAGSHLGTGRSNTRTDPDWSGRSQTAVRTGGNQPARAGRSPSSRSGGSGMGSSGIDGKLSQQFPRSAFFSGWALAPPERACRRFDAAARPFLSEFKSENRWLWQRTSPATPPSPLLVKGGSDRAGPRTLPRQPGRDASHPVPICTAGCEKSVRESG